MLRRPILDHGPEAVPPARAADEGAGPRGAVLAAAPVGLCLGALGVAWARVLAVLVAPPVDGAAIALAAGLGSTALGGLLRPLLPLRRVPPRVRLGLAALGIGLASAAPAQLVPRLVRLVAPGAPGLGAGAALAACLLVLLVPCALAGAALRMAGEARARLGVHPLRSLAESPALGALGALGGALAARELLIPGLGLQRALLLGAAASAAFGLALCAGAARRSRFAPALAAAGGACLLAGAFALPRWDVRPLAAFRSDVPRPYEAAARRQPFARTLAETSVRAYAEGRRASVAVLEQRGRRTLLEDGARVASDAAFDLELERLRGHLPVLLHPRPRRALVLGCGDGVALSGVLAHAELERAVLVEREPAVIDAARELVHVHDDPFADPRLTVLARDAPGFLRASSERFDVVIAGPLPRGRAAARAAERFGALRAALAPGGLVCQPLPLWELAPAELGALLRAFTASFAHATLWQATYDGVLIGGAEPLALDAARLARRMQAPEVRRQLAQVGLEEPPALLCELALDEPGVARVAGGALAGAADCVRALGAWRPAHASLGAALAAAGGAPNAEAWRRAKGVAVEQGLALGRAAHEPDPASVVPIVAALEREREVLPAYGRTASLLALAHALHAHKLAAAHHDERALGALRRAVEVRPDDAEACYALAARLSDAGQAEEALALFAAALASRPRFALALKDCGVTLMRLGRFADAEGYLRRAVQADARLAAAHHDLGVALMSTGRAREAEDAFRRALALAPDLPGLHNNFALLLAGERRLGEARELLERGRALDPDDLHLMRELAWLLATAPDLGLRDARRALALAERVDAATGGASPLAQDALAAALAEAGRFGEAAGIAAHAAELAAEQGQSRLAQEIRARGALYAAGRPFRSPGAAAPEGAPGR